MTVDDFGSFSLVVGDAREQLRLLPAASFNAVITSPPYFGLRDYGTGRWEGGDDPSCEHKRGNARPDHSHGTFLGTRGKQGQAAASAKPERQVCRTCGARRVDDKQIGLEPTIADFVAALVDVFAEVHRVLADDGTVWLNLGDSYVSDGGERRAAGANDGPKREEATSSGVIPPDRRTGQVLKQKDKMLIPHRVAIALQDWGWYVRQDAVWHKPNPLPEAVKDRPMTAHEYVFLLSKSERYYFDAEAVREPTTGGAHPRGRGLNPKAADPDRRLGRVRANASFQAAISGDLVDTRQLRSVWTIPTQPFSGAHFATFPEELARLCILAGSAVGGRVLDPFSGSGTVAAVGVPLGRHCTGIELSEAFADLSRRRVAEAVEEARRARAQLTLLPAADRTSPRGSPARELWEQETLAIFFGEKKA